MSEILQVLYLSNLQPTNRSYQLQGGEKETYIANPSVFSSKLFSLFLLASIFSALSIIQTWDIVLSGGAFLVSLLLLFVEYIRIRKTFYYVTNRRVLRVNTFLTNSVDEILFEDISDIKENQSFFHSMFQVGTLTFETNRNKSMKFKSVYDFRELEHAVYMALPEDSDETTLESVVSEERLQNANDEQLN